jgi:hypothetical protein
MIKKERCLQIALLLALTTEVMARANPAPLTQELQ